MGIRVALVLLLFSLVAPASASAGRMFVSPGDITLFQYQVEFGVENDVTITPDGASVVIHDAGEPIIANECQQVDEHTVRCTPGPGATAFTGINTYDGDDRITIDGVTHVAPRQGPATTRSRRTSAAAALTEDPATTS